MALESFRVISELKHIATESLLDDIDSISKELEKVELQEKIEEEILKRGELTNWKSYVNDNEKLFNLTYEEVLYIAYKIWGKLDVVSKYINFDGVSSVRNVKDMHKAIIDKIIIHRGSIKY